MICTFRHACAIALALTVGVAHAFPDKNLTIVVPTSAGGGNDAMARVIAQRMSVSLGKPVVVENRAGANGAIASEYVARAKPDGHTILFGYIATHGINPALQKLRYDPVKDFAPIGMVANSPTLVVVNPMVKAGDMQQLIDLARTKDANLNYASAGSGTAPHAAAELFRLATQTQMVHVPYKGSAPALVDTIAGNTQIMFPSLFTAYPQIRNGKVRVLAVASSKRTPLLRDTPTLNELGIDVAVDQWYAMFSPAGTPPEIVARLNAELNAALRDQAVADKIAEQGAYVQTSTPQELGALVSAEVAKWKRVVQAAGMTTD
ncbi:Bug family tripartite tricarboxylate transporter substrate binding protein [Cupriavidus basilensis]|uniref:Tripartite tricarboxylate transporter substrate binding protein n=1 Tax=Cupriavidus basilensis TaxID=68895 RepID=A0A643FY33_9BURK|nr:tripartite tricarboxylate transporter substrate binding protein [Cupriavidus basilensis]QOT80414.1 tripartite tricarboxylate transporter substrate binding protein [Cupriavidus basilensis]